MKVSELIEQLSAYPQNSTVYLWVDGERIAVTSVDDTFTNEHWFIEINGEKT